MVFLLYNSSYVSFISTNVYITPYGGYPTMVTMGHFYYTIVLISVVYFKQRRNDSHLFRGAQGGHHPAWSFHRWTRLVPAGSGPRAISRRPFSKLGSGNTSVAVARWCRRVRNGEYHPMNCFDLSPI